MEFRELNKLVKYCTNRINLDEFILLMMPRYNDKNYISNLWPQFRDNSILFIVSRGEKELLSEILDKIEETNYEG